jgi:sialate O-acetylesterase
MVLQRDREILIWGKADPAERVSVIFAGIKRSAAANSRGQWAVHFAAMPAGGPFTLRVVGKKTIIIKDVMVGEVWIASGQSNMAFAMAESAGAAEEIPRAVYPNLRLFTVPKRDVLDPQNDTLPAKWLPCSPEAVREFSAVAYYFARDLHRKLNVPIGIIESAWPGTAIEEWTAPEAAQRDPQLKPIFDDWNQSQGTAFASGRTPFDLEFDDFELLPDPSGSAPPLALANFDDGRASTALGGDWSYVWKDAPETTFELTSPGRGGKGFAAHVAGGIDATDDSRVIARLHLDGSPADVSAYAGIRFWVRGNGAFRFRSLQPTITDWDDYATQLLHASADWAPVTIWFRDLRQEGWGVVTDLTLSSLTGFSIESVPTAGYPQRPSTGLYQGMIAPLRRFAFRGAIWYQGESNAMHARQYRRLLPSLIESWRAGSHQEQMQFLIVQLPNLGAIPGEPAESAWAEMREAELLTLKSVPATGLAVTIDVGDPKDLHPHRKAEVGQRLALWALGAAYNQPIVYSGPLYQSMAVEGSKIRVRFTHTGSGLQAVGGALRGFAIAGADRKFHWASAVIDGDAVLVSNPEVAAPVAVRYAWADSPECNLFNAEGLPASPFRTDDWAGITK